MIKNYLKIAFRHLKKQKLHSIINIAGLTVGMAVSILILSYVWFELSFDRFHSKYGQIYRVVQSHRYMDNEKNTAQTGYFLGSTLKEEFPEILHTTRLGEIYQIEISYNEKKIVVMPGEGVVTADNDIFKIFDIDLIHGDPETALLDPNSIILTEEESRRFFGNENPMGKIITIQKEYDNAYVRNLVVTGVAKAMPDNSHFEFKYLIPLDLDSKPWDAYLGHGRESNYLTLPVDYPPENLENKFPEIVRKYFGPEIESRWSIIYDDLLESGGYWKLGLQPLKHIHLSNQHYDFESTHIKKGNLFHVQIYTVIALLIIALACINFITLSTVRSGARAKEVGLRKVNGATRKQLIWQFLSESIMISIIAMVFAVIVVAVFSKPFNKLLEIQSSHNFAGIVFIVVSLFIVTLVIGVIAGSYPAFILSTFRPVEVLKGQLLKNMKGMAIRNSLVVFQFIISMILIISSIAVYKQFVYMQNKDLGFEKENIVIIKNLKNVYYEDPKLLRKDRELKFATFLQEVLKHPNVVNASLSENMPGKFYMYYPQFWRLEGATETKYEISVNPIDHAYLDVFGLEMAAGQNFSKGFTIPQTREGIIINEKAANRLGLKNPVGKYIFTDEWKNVINSEGKKEEKMMEVQIPIIGVFKDFHTDDLHQDIKPVIFFPQFKDHFSGFFIAVRFLPGNIPDNISFLEKTWNNMSAKVPFEYSFFDKELEIQYNKEKKLIQVFTFFTILAIFIACLGIYGLAAFTAEQRTKEIGIRKVMGASVRTIVKTFSRIYLKFLIIATLIACPVGYIIMNKWLQGFAFRINIGAGIFIFSVLITAIIILSSVSYHSIKAALTNPANTLKYE